MTDLRKIPDATDRWRATIEALGQIVLAEAGKPEAGSEIDTATAEEVRRLIMVRLVALRRTALPAAWVRRPGVVLPPPAGAEPEPELAEPPLDRRTRSRPAWRE
jgi:hypothetical protein